MVRTRLPLIGLLLALLTVPACQVVLGIDPDVAILDGGADGNTPPGADGGSSTCDGALVCDEFEAPAIDSVLWPNLDIAGGSLTIDATHTNRNSRGALHAHTDAIAQVGRESAGAMLERVGSLPTHFFVRFFAFVAAPAPQAEPEILINLQTDHGGMQLYVEDEQLTFTSWANTPSLNVRSGTPFTYGDWHCIEWEVDQSQKRMTVSFDRGAVATLSRSDVVMPAYDHVKLGLTFGAPPVQPAYDVWLDDVRIDTKPIGCGP